MQSISSQVNVFDCKSSVTVALFQVEAPIVGIIENMSYYKCKDCGNKHHIFGSNLQDKMKGEALREVPILGKLPIKPGVSENCDSGVPSVVVDSEICDIFDQIVHSVIPFLEHDD